MLRTDTIRHILAASLPTMGIKADANETLAYSRQLEHIYTTVLETKYPESAGRRMIPVNYNVDTGAESHSYRMTDDVGEADIVDSYADDLPLVDAFSLESPPQRIVSIGDAFIVSIQDIRRANLLGMNIDTRKAVAARRMMERKLDKLLAVGEARAGLTGFANDPGVAGEMVVATGGSWLLAGTTNDTIIADITKLTGAIFTGTGTVYGNPDNNTKVVLAITPDHYMALANRRLDAFNKDTLLSYIKNMPQIEDVVAWNRLSRANAAGTGGRLIAYVRDPEVVEAVIPQEFEIMAVQPRNLAFYHPCHMRYGGIAIRHRKAVRYMDNG